MDGKDCDMIEKENRIRRIRRRNVDIYFGILYNIRCDMR